MAVLTSAARERLSAPKPGMPIEPSPQIPDQVPQRIPSAPHLFTDESLPEYEASKTRVVLERTFALLAGLTSRGAIDR